MALDDGWIGSGRVRARDGAGVLEIVVDGLTTQAKYYKPLVYEFFRKEWRGSRPAWGEFEVDIRMEYQGDPPWLDLDNLAKALLDAIKGYAFHDDAQVARLLVERHGGEVPQTREELEALPGVGRKTANVVLNTAFRQLTMAVDTHIFRVSNRTGIAPGKNVVEVENKLMKFVPKEYLLDSHHWLILHGRYVCLARKPRCGSCRIEDLCEYKHKTSDD